jgi:transposase
MTSDFSYITYKQRVKDSNHINSLEQLSREVNFVWNELVRYQEKVVSNWKAGRNDCKWPSHFDFNNWSRGTKELLIVSTDTVSEICKTFIQSRNFKKKTPRKRHSFGPKRSLGWIPFLNRVKLGGDYLIYCKRKFRFWKEREFEGEFKTGCFVQEADGKWYVCFVYKVLNDKESPKVSQVGVDLGYATFATLSDGTKYEHEREFRNLESKIGTAQRARNKKRSKALHKKARNKRKHFLHTLSNTLTKDHDYIVVGDLNSGWMSRNGFGKSVTDTSHGTFKHMLLYKSARRRGTCVVTNEAYTTQVCSVCGEKPPQRPKGRKNLGMRVWTCSGCDTPHDRDVNAARNILKLGLDRQPPVAGIFVCQ